MKKKNLWPSLEKTHGQTEYSLDLDSQLIEKKPITKL